MELLKHADPESRDEAPGADDFLPSWTDEDDKLKAVGYLPDNHLIDATNVALILDQPLLLTGEPGTGKTQFAYYVSWKLRRDPPLIFETKSTSTARDLFYTYDTLGHFHAAQARRAIETPAAQAAGAAAPAAPARPLEAREFITYNALGIAILRANAKAQVEQWAPEGSDVFGAGGARRSVVVVDEIDKAPRDFPNDLLNEVEQMYFRVPELGLTGSKKIGAPKSLRPLLILTSNSEKHLPEAFLRRCVYYHIPFPKGKELEKIISSRLRGLSGLDGWVKDALNLFGELRKLDTRLDKKPATAELLGWLKALHRLSDGSANPFRDQHDLILRTARATLLKSYNDQTLGETVVQKWLKDVNK